MRQWGLPTDELLQMQFVLYRHGHDAMQLGTFSDLLCYLAAPKVFEDDWRNIRGLTGHIPHYHTSHRRCCTQYPS
jgi:hypothetical protein